MVWSGVKVVWSGVDMVCSGGVMWSGVQVVEWCGVVEFHRIFGKLKVVEFEGVRPSFFAFSEKISKISKISKSYNIRYTISILYILYMTEYTIYD